MFFTYNRGRLCVLFRMEGVEPSTYDDVLPQLLTDLLNPSIQHAKYLSPAGYSVMFCDPWDLTPTNHAHCNQALDCNISNLITTLSYTCSQIGFAGRPAPPVTLHKPWFPCGPVDLCSFPCICFTVTSTGFVSERSLAAVSRLAWMDHLAMAQSCRRILLWADHSAYPSGAKPPIFSIFKELVLAVFTYVSCNLGCNFLLLF